jgi:hypothetical protein
MKPSQYPHTNELGFAQNPAYPNRPSGLLNALMAAVAILTLCATAARAQTPTNWLANGDFERSVVTNWVNMPPWTWNGATFAINNTNDFVYGSGTIHVAVHGGTNAFKIWGYFQSYATTVGAMQTFPCAAGSTWAASGWASTQTPDNMTSTDASYIEVQFLGASANVLLDCVSGNMTPASPVNTWTPFEVLNPNDSTTNLVAPDGTAFVRFLIRFYQPGGYPGGSCYWDDVKLVRTSKPDPEITVHPTAVERVYGQTATFSVVADGLTALSYKWQKDLIDITDPNAHGVNTATLTLSNVSSSMMGYYAVTVTDQAGSITSDSAYLSVLDPGILTVTPPVGQTKTNGDTATFAVTAASSSALSYAWQLNNNPLSNGGRITGATSNVLTVANVGTADVGTYTLLINGGAALTNLGLKVVSSAQLATNLLVNAGFEDGVLSLPWESAWVPFNGIGLATTNDFYYLTAIPVSVYDGNYVGHVFASNPDNGLYEPNVPAVAGATYHAGGHFYVSSLDPMTGLAWVVLQVMFKNAGGGTIATYTAPQIGTNFTTDAWTFLQVSNATAGGFDLVAPDGTAAITCQVYEYAQQGGGGSVYFDDLYVMRTSQPAPPAVTLSASYTGSAINISFPSTAGVTYEVLYAGSLPSGTWQTNSTITGDGTVKTVSDPTSADARFYRVRAHN